MTTLTKTKSWMCFSNTYTPAALNSFLLGFMSLLMLLWSFAADAQTSTAKLDRGAWTVEATNNNANANKAIDASIESRWDTSQEQQAGQSFIINMQEVKLVDRVLMITNNGHANNQDYPRNFSVFVSADGSNWIPVVENAQGSNTSETLVSFSLQPVQFIQIELNEGVQHFWWSIHDLSVYGADLVTSENQSPSVSFTGSTPTHNRAIQIDSEVNIEVNANDPDGEISSVFLTINGQPVSTLVQPPFIWSSSAEGVLDGLTQGSYVLRALATDNNGASTSVSTSFLVDTVAQPGNRHPDITNVLNIRLEDIPYGPDPVWWGDSYSVGDQCYCDTTFDHDIGDIQVRTSQGFMTVKQACELVGPGPGSEGRPRYNTVQCGHMPGNGENDEEFCPGQINAEGTEQQRKLGCNNIGPTWKLPEQPDEPQVHSDIVANAGRTLNEIPYGPDPIWWGDSYSVGDQCYCDSTFDHGAGDILVETELGTMTAKAACDLIGEGPGSEGRPRYNDIQCGNGPSNGENDENFCPGQINVEGTDEERRLGCNNIGPKWNFSDAHANASNDEPSSRHPDIVQNAGRTLAEIPYAPDPVWWGDSYSVGDQCYCDSTFDHGAGDILVETELGTMTAKAACDLIGEGPGPEGRPRYNDIQCGNGPSNGENDENFCPGQINVEGTEEERRLGCNNIGPKFKF